LVRTAAEVPGAGGDVAVRGGLEALGARLEDGDAHDWPVDRAVAAALSPALADALAAHVSIAADALAGSSDGELASSAGAMLRGLGFITLDRAAAAVVESALGRWVAVQPVPDWTNGPPPAFPVIVIPNAYLAVQQYGQNLGHALDEIDLERQAENRAFLWNMTIGLAAQLAPGLWGRAAGVVVDYVAMWLDMDGTWEAGPDGELTFQPGVPTPPDVEALSADEYAHLNTLVDLAKQSFGGTAHALGLVDVPSSAAKNWWAPLQGAVTVGPGDLLDAVTHGRGHVPSIR
jgi:hypothetical protein